METPAIVRLDDRLDRLNYPLLCQSCHQPLVKGELVFFSKPAGYKYWHSKAMPNGDICFDPIWKAPGSPYHIRKQKAIAHKLSMKTDKDLIKLALRRFRKELIIPILDLKLKPEVFIYLKRNHLIEEDEHKKTYVIIPKGFNWNVDAGCVQMPTMDEDIRERDQEIEIKEEEVENEIG